MYAEQEATTLDREKGATTTQTLEARPSVLGTWLALLRRDLLVTRREFIGLIIMFLLQPVLFLLVFAELLPETLLATQEYKIYVSPGIVSLALFLAGMQSMAIKIGAAFGWTREIDDVVLAPIPHPLIAIEKMIIGGLLAVSAMIAIVLLSEPLVTDWPVWHEWRWGLVVAVACMGGLASGAMGVAVGTMVRANNVGRVFSLILAPMMFLGGPFYPWVVLENYPVLKGFALLNPLLYVSEGMRAAMAPDFPTLPLWACFLGMGVSILLFAWGGILGFRKRVRE